MNENKIINLGTGMTRRINEVIKIIQEQIPGIKIKEMEKGEFFEASCADISKLIKLIGWQPKVTLEEGIRKVVDYKKRSLEGG